MKLLVLGSGGREHALAHTFYRQGHTVFCLPGNPGTDPFCEKIEAPFSLNDHETLVAIAKKYEIDLTVVGPEALLAEGIVDAFLAHDLPIFGPCKQAARLESEKSFAKNFMRKHHVPTARFVVCKEPEDAKKAVRKHFHEWGGVVIKPSGLTAGKGVTVCHTIPLAEIAIDLIMKEQCYGEAGGEVVIEETLSGQEVSILAFCDGKEMVPMIPSQDHKRLLDQDEGPNTGGMGAYAPVPFIHKKDLEKIQNEVIDAANAGLQKEGIDYRGILYFGLMMTHEGPKVLEFNCRFGDPEAQVVLPLIESDLAEIMHACCLGKLNEQTVAFYKKFACGVVMSSEGYPTKVKTGLPISGLEKIGNKDIFCFHAGTKKDEQGSIITNGGRVLCVTALGGTLEAAVQKAYTALEAISFDGAHYRKDIAQKAAQIPAC